MCESTTVSPEPAEHVGSLSEEAAKLVASLQDWAHDHRDAGGGQPDPTRPGPTQLTGAECRYCPLCNLARAARAPGVREHLSKAALSLALALQGLAEEFGDASRGDGAGVEKIDVAED